ncbi:hypothetical protein COCVIDRAFT_43194 [Bipolaris victoriae FI3]|uniref:Uncharacterized protein n=1 Tax=Bipolaris victoriae (strain FI3) TaxID=930091 RepID=W7E974_BIPV3|nr:hypothetical protein COCVIDRAFT_43194 [Bipolaris victoriae FI3]
MYMITLVPMVVYHPTGYLHHVFIDIKIGLHPRILSEQLTTTQIQQQDEESTLPDDLSAAETQLLEALNTRNETRKALEAAQKGQQDAIEKLTRERVTYSNARKELSTLRNTLDSTLAELDSTHKTIESQTTGLTTLQIKVHHLQSCLDTSEEHRKQEALMHQSWIRQSLSTSSVTMAETRNLQDQVTQMRQRCEAWYSMYHSTHTTMEHQIAAMSSALTATHAENRELDSLNENLKYDVNKLQAKIESLEDDQDLLWDEKWELEGEVQKLTIELAECKASNHKLVIKLWKAKAGENDDEDDEDVDEEQRESEKAIMDMVDLRLDSMVEMERVLKALGVQEQENEEKQEDEVEDEDDDIKSSEGDEKSDADMNGWKSLDGTETSQAPVAPSAIPVVQLYWGMDMADEEYHDEDDEDEEEYYEEEYDYVDENEDEYKNEDENEDEYDYVDGTHY